MGVPNFTGMTVLAQTPFQNLKTDWPQINDNKLNNIDTSFHEILKNINNENKSENKNGETGLEEIKNKIDEIEKKIDRLLSNKDQKPADIEKVKAISSMVNEIKKILSGLNAKNVSPDIKPLNAGTTLMSFINQILEEIRTLLESQEKPDKSLSIDTVKKQLERLAGQIKAAGALNNSDKVEGSRNQTDKDYTDDEKGLNSPQSKVTVIDKRTIVDKASTMNDGVSKNKKGEITEGQPSIKIKTIGVKDENANSLKLIEKDISDKAHAKETSSIINNKAEAAAQSGKTIPPYTLSANRAGLEALLQNISGRALITLRNGKSELRMTLFPPELGRMNMKFTLEEGRMTAQIVVNTPEAKMIFDQNLGDLQRALQQAGINIGNLNVNLSGHDLDRNDSPSAMETSDKTGFENQGNEIVDDINGSYHSLYESRINYLA